VDTRRPSSSAPIPASPLPRRVPPRSWIPGIHGRHPLLLGASKCATESLVRRGPCTRRLGFAQWAVLLATAHLAINLVMTFTVIKLLDHRFRVSQRPDHKWEEGWKSSANPASAWPFNWAIERVGRALEIEKLLVPGAAATALLLSIIRK